MTWVPVTTADEAQPGIGASKVRCRECAHAVPDEHCADNPDVRWCPVYGQYRFVRLERECAGFEATLATCIGCGCDDLHACVREFGVVDIVDPLKVEAIRAILETCIEPDIPGRFVEVAATLKGTCHWLRLDRAAGLGVCSACPGSVERWDAGDRDLDELSLLKP